MNCFSLIEPTTGLGFVQALRTGKIVCREGLPLIQWRLFEGNIQYIHTDVNLGWFTAPHVDPQDILATDWRVVPADQATKTKQRADRYSEELRLGRI